MAYRENLNVEEGIISLFQPDILLPSQYFDTLRRKFDLDSERRLMLAVLEDAAACFQKYLSAHSGRGKNLFSEAEHWIFNENGDWLFSFENICEVLGFDASYLRQGLQRWRGRRLGLRHKISATHSPAVIRHFSQAGNGRRRRARLKELYQERRAVQLR